MRWQLLAPCSVALLAAAMATCGAAARGTSGDGRIRVLVVTGGHDFDKQGFLSLFAGLPDVEFRHVSHPVPDDLYAGQFDALVLYDMYQAITDRQKADLQAAIKGGKGLVVLHHALGNYQEWPEYEKIIGGRYYLSERVVGGALHPRSTYQHGVKVTVRVADKRHPVLRGIGDFEIVDEVYALYDVAPTAKPLLRVSHPQSAEVVAWTHQYGKGRVVCIQLGHDQTAYSNPSYRRLVANAIRWVAQADPLRRQPRRLH
jgi:type 1 glutamine amidotransferase